MRELGNPYKDAPGWREDYRALLEREGEPHIREIAGMPGPVCLLCAEKKAAACHRSLVAEFMAERLGAEVVHLE